MSCIFTQGYQADISLIRQDIADEIDDEAGG